MFENVKATTKKAQSMIESVDWYVNRYGYRSIFDAYKNPSDTKVAIYHDWERFAVEHGADICTVLGANCFMFTMAIVYNEDGNRILLYITPNHNYRVVLA